MKIVTPRLFPGATQTGIPSEGLMGEHSTHLQGGFDGLQDSRTTTIDKFPDDVLLEVFGLYLGDESPYKLWKIDEWHTLVHVCRRWRHLVFASPRCLNLRLCCTTGRPVRKMLDIWPALPIEIRSDLADRHLGGLGNIVAALRHPHRVHHVSIVDFIGREGEKLAAAMRVPFPELTYLELRPYSSAFESVPALPDSFLGGSAPRLQTLRLTNINIPLPAVRDLLLSAGSGDLAHLTLTDLPHSGYISPESMVACLSSVKRLETLHLGFQSPRSRPDRPSPPRRQTRVALPALVYFAFRGRSEYSEDLLARIDAPVLGRFSTFFVDLVMDVPHLKQFIGHAKGLRVKPCKAAKVLFNPWSVQLELDDGSSLGIGCRRIDWQVSLMAMLWTQLSPFFLVERLDFVLSFLPSGPEGREDVVPNLFLELFRPFATIHSFYVSKTLVPLIALALQELVGERVTEVLPNLRKIFLGGSAETESTGSVQGAIKPFVAARQLSGQPIVVHSWQEWCADL